MKLPRRFPISNAPKESGFTLIEILVTVAIITVLVGMALFLSFDSFRRYNLNAERDMLVGVLETARSRALNNMFESQHGVCYLSPGNYSLFRGATYDVAKSEIMPSNGAISVTGLATCAQGSAAGVIFTQLTGAPTAAVGTITLSDGAKSKTIDINNEGTIIW